MSRTQHPWKSQVVALTLSFLEVASAAPSADASTKITRARVQQVLAASNNVHSVACCTLIQGVVGSILSQPGSVPYNTSTSTYFSAQAQAIDPWCIVSPTTTLEVSQTLDSLNLIRRNGLECPFAIRSGGHTPWAGAATIENGITISLAALNQVVVSSDNKVTSIGPGARWFDVYSKLDPLGLTVVGGRAATVGVGGLVTGGGISFFSPRYGFSVDNLESYEVVLYDGLVVTASASRRADLFWALKGGSNNFGVVTRIDAKTYAQGPFWGGQLVLTSSAKAESLSAFYHFTAQPKYDIYGALINTHVFTASTGWLVVNIMHYTKPVSNPSVFQNFTVIQPQIASSLRNASMTEFSAELSASNPVNAKQIFYTSTWGNDLALLTQIVDAQEEFVNTVSDVSSLNWSLSLQPLVTAITKISANTGGNALGLDASDGNLVLGLVTVSWEGSSNDATVTAAVENFFAKADALAAAAGKLNEYKYLNYAYKNQNPIKGYGAANVARLRGISKKYDPQGVFQKLVPGGWKL